MDRVEAKWLLLRTLAEYHNCSYEQLRAMIGSARYVECRGTSGAEYQMEVDFIWDKNDDGDIRVLASIDDGRWRAICPLVYDFLVSPTN